MIFYGDTSALAKRYLDETGSDIVGDYLDEAELRYTSALTQLELVATIESAKRIRRINSPNYRMISAKLETDIHQGLLTLMDVSPGILKRAIPLIRIRCLRAPDAIQLATALELGKQINGDLHFLCADHALLDAARSEGLSCKDVSS